MEARCDELGARFTTVAVFDSPLDNLQRHIERSLGGMLKGMALRAPTLLRAMSRGYVPTSLKGNLTTMPADLLIDEAGVIPTAHYGKDESDHLAFKAVAAFSRGDNAD